ncbi:baseplate hub subunit and tail lysozyme [Cronobacter phage vB_CsaM_GAP32]|uniref:Lysozyme n=1 Tax=Cronobacter phage vB_CsaM_GAP32 TaxID=1141136 RepID=K4FB41_9CAUD|nr:baseplate hub subunit and tail lysozyme [Cronobacter phage vB_CsaM_GAP32]AFC21684.1 baseplate hub subunit and tail lysozyme [Cronobacter phage vB_CsaM_GAP32]
MADSNNSKSQAFANNQKARFNPQFVQLATVMDNRDPTRTGKLKVWIQNSQSDRDSKGSWITASYLSPFAGRTPGTPGAESYQQFPKGYGFWGVPPDVGVTVAVFFANGNIHDCWWFACGYDDRMNTMVPGSATQKLPDSGYDMPVPITDYDRNTLQTQIDQKYINVPLVEGLKKQNLLYDEQKGIPNRSSTRQTISTVYGLSSPRGNSFIVDDGFTESELTAPSWDDDPDSYQDTQFGNPVNDTTVGLRKNEGIVLRTRSGAQFLLSESDGNVFLINRDGTARFEMTADGQITVHSDKSITIRTDEDFNLSVARDMNVEIGRNLNVHTQADTKLNLVGKLDAIVNGQVVINTGADLRLVAAASIRVQSGASTNITSGENTAIKTGSTMDVTAPSSINLSGGGTNFNISGTVDSSSQINAPDVVTPSVGLNSHIHYHAAFSSADNHSNEMAPPVNGGGSPNTKPAAEPQPANDVAPVAPTQQAQETVQYINSTQEVGQVLTQDLVVSDGDEDDTTVQSYTTTYEGLQLFMPCTGTIREFGYWGKGVPTQTGTNTNRNGWIIQAKGDVVAPEGGLITKMGNGGIIITHPIGYKSIFYDITATVNNKDTVKKGEKIGTANGVFEYEIRLQSANIYGFSGTVDPGLFFSSVTGKGKDCANKSLTIGKPSNPNPKPATGYSPDSSELVVITTVNSIGSAYSQRGSKHVPRKTTRSKQNGNSSANTPPEDLSNIDKTAVDWKVLPSDSKLIEEVKEFEGTIEYQTAVGYYRNGRFWIYKDSLGYPTIGYGHLITARDNFGGGIDEAQADALLQKDLIRTVRDAQSIYAQYNMKTPYICQIVLTEMCFQMGKGSVLKFKNTLAAMARGDYKAAAAGIRNSAWYRQTPRRAEVMARRVESCQ